MIELSVLICTHNPNEGRMRQVVAALAQQDLSLSKWELIVVDNASVAMEWLPSCLSWHPKSLIVSEATLGLTPARLKGIASADADLLVFVDDDNVLDRNYLSTALEIGQTWPMLGAWGGGISPLFASEPPVWTEPYWPMLAIREVTGSRWGNDTSRFDHVPCGAGMCVRRAVAVAYTKRLRQDATRFALDRVGDSLNSCGDTDLALTSADLEMGTGVFHSLHMIHIIPSERMAEPYLLRLVEEMHFSHVVLGSIRGHCPPPRPGIMRRLIHKAKTFRLDPISRKFRWAAERGVERGRAAVRSRRSL